MKSDFIGPIQRNRPPSPQADSTLKPQAPQSSISSEAAIAKLKPELKGEMEASEKVLQVSNSLSDLGEKSVDAVKSLDPGRVQDLLSED